MRVDAAAGPDALVTDEIDAADAYDEVVVEPVLPRLVREPVGARGEGALPLALYGRRALAREAGLIIGCWSGRAVKDFRGEVVRRCAGSESTSVPSRSSSAAGAGDYDCAVSPRWDGSL